MVVTAVDVGESVRLTVDDNGAGMSAEILGKVGTPFFSTRPEGTGLGVAQCRRLVEGAGGTFSIESVEGQGTTVTFTIPEGVSDGASWRDGCATVLVVDDDTDAACRRWSAICARAGSTVLPAPTAERALEIARTRRPDCALVDLCIGEDSGIDLLRDAQGGAARSVGACC